MDSTTDTMSSINHDGLGRFRNGGFCGNPYKNFLIGFCSKMQDAFFFVNVLQFALVTLMYVHVGKGRYWQILFYASIGGFVGSLIENGTVAFLCSENEQKTPRYHVLTFFLAEFCWVIEEYSIPFLNLTKMKAFSKGKASKIINYIILVLFIAFVTFRFCIGYHRMTSGLLTNNKIKLYHSLAFAVMATADIICSFGILYFVRKHNQHEAVKNSNINHYIKRSSYMILLCVDVVGICLSFFNFVIEQYDIPEDYLTPFHCVKCAFILILACDALLFKYSVNTSSIHESSGNYRYGQSEYTYGSTYKNLNKSRNNYNIDITNKSQNNQLSSIVTPYNNFPSLDYGKSEGTYQTKSIIKNYTNIKPSPTSTMYDNSPDSDKTYSTSQPFGFLYSKDY